MQQQKSPLPTIITIMLVLALLFVMTPKGTFASLLENASSNAETIASAMPSQVPSPTTTPIAVPSELGPNATEVVPNAQATAGIPTIAPTPQLRLEDLPAWGVNPDMMEYRAALSSTSSVSDMAYLVLGGRSACFVGEANAALITYTLGVPKALSMGFNLIGIDLPESVSSSFDSESQVSSTVCGTVLFGVRMDDVVNTSTVQGDGIWETTNTAGKRINPDTGEEELFQVFEQGANFESQPTICLVGVHVNDQIVNSTYNQPGAVYRAFFPMDMGNQFAAAFESAWAQFVQPENIQPGAEIARDSLVGGKAHEAMCSFLDLVDGGASHLNSCVFKPRIPTTIQYCGDLNIPSDAITPSP